MITKLTVLSYNLLQMRFTCKWDLHDHKINCSTLEV